MSSFRVALTFTALALCSPARVLAQPEPLAIGVEGNRLVDAHHQRLRIIGVNHSGAEYACVSRGRVFDSPADESMARALARWNINVVRLALNESCWLGARGLSAASSGARYQHAISEFVRKLHTVGIYVILELHWSAPGDRPAMGQQPMPDRDRSVRFWDSVAQTFRDDRAVMFDLFNEPYPDTAAIDTADPWDCWRDGCTMVGTLRDPHIWRAVGMQELIFAVRAAGARQPIVVGGVAWAHDLRGWLTHRLFDPEHALVASFHAYMGLYCDTERCWESELAPIENEVPVVATEIGEDDRGHGFIDAYTAWSDARGGSYLAWSWNAWHSPFALISDWRGRPASRYGAAFLDHLRGH